MRNYQVNQKDSDMTQKDGQDRKYWPASKAATYLGYSLPTLRRFAAEGKIPCVISPGGRYKYCVAEFEAVAKEASAARLRREAVKLEAKKAKAKAKAESDRKAKLEARRDRLSNEPPLPFMEEANAAK